MRVEIIKEESRYKLEEKVNSKLKGVMSERILDIKYTGNGNSGTYSIREYSAMIIFKD